MIKRSAPAAPDCASCGEKTVRDPRPPSSNVYERVDNGFQVKAVERLAEVERMSSDRSRGIKR